MSAAGEMADASAFPYGLRVLVVDDDPTWLKILEKMLRKCSYEGSNLCLSSFVRSSLELDRCAAACLRLWVHAIGRLCMFTVR